MADNKSVIIIVPRAEAMKEGANHREELSRHLRPHSTYTPPFYSVFTPTLKAVPPAGPRPTST